MSDDNLDEGFNMATDSHGFHLVNHNETNFGSFHDFQRRMDDVYEKLDKETMEASRRANLKKWDSQLSPPWNEARLNKINDSAAVKTVEDLINKHGLCSFFIKGEKGTGKTFMALAIVRRFIGRGSITPSQVKHLSEDDIINIARSGFKASDRIQAELLNPKFKFFVIDNVGYTAAYDSNTMALWNQFFEHVSKRNLRVIFTSQFSANNFVEKLSENAQAKVSYLINGKIVPMSGVLSPPTLLDEPTAAEEIELIKDEESIGQINSFKGSGRSRRR